MKGRIFPQAPPGQSTGQHSHCLSCSLIRSELVFIGQCKFSAAVQGVLDDSDCQETCACSHGSPAGGAGVPVDLAVLPLFQTTCTHEMTSRTTGDRTFPGQRDADRALHNLLFSTSKTPRSTSPVFSPEPHYIFHRHFLLSSFPASLRCHWPNYP